MINRLLVFIVLNSLITFGQGPTEWFINVGADSGNNNGSLIAESNNLIFTLMDLDGPRDVNPGSGTNNFSSDNVIVRYNQSGSFLSALDLDDDLNVVDMETDGNGNLYLVGTFSGTITIGSNTHFSNSGSIDVFMAKFNSNLVFQYSQAFGGSNNDYVTDLIAGNIFFHIVGYFEQSVDFDPSSGVDIKTSNGSFDNYVARFSSGSGAYQWAQNFGSTGNESQPIRIAKTGSNLYILGKYSAPFDINPGTGVVNLSGSVNFYILVLSTSNNYVTHKTFNSNDILKNTQRVKFFS